MRLLAHRIWFRKRVANHGGRALGIDVLILFAMMALLLSRADAAVHPVPLDKNTDAAKCLECHEDKSKGKAVHSAIAMGCLSCHEIRVNKDITRVKLITSTPQALCITCHADKDAASLKGTVHPPALRDCIRCHDPHVSNNKNQLLKATAGEKGKALAVNFPMAEPKQRLRVLLEGTQVRYYLERGNELLQADCGEQRVDRGVYLLLAELAMRD